MNAVHLIFLMVWYTGIGIAIYQFHTRKGYFYKTILSIAIEKDPNMDRERFRTKQMFAGWLVLVVSIGIEVYQQLRR